MKVNLNDKFASFSEHWSPKVVGELNGQYVKIVKCSDEYVWHHHDDEDELFLILSGRMTICLRESDDVVLERGEFLIVPRGVEHKPVAHGETHILLFEPATTRNTGNVDHNYTIEPGDLERL